VNVLLLTQVLPYPPDSGPKVKTWNLIKWLAAEGHSVTLVSFVRGESVRALDALRPYLRAVHAVPMRRGALRDGAALLASLVSGRPFVMVRDDRAAMRHLVERVGRATRFDIAHADQLNMAQYAQRVPGAARVLDTHNALWVLYRRLAGITRMGPRRALLEREWRRLRQYEGAVCRVFDAVVAVTEEDRRALGEASGGGRETAVVPIAVDPDELRPVQRRPDADRIVHLGTMYWPPNGDGVRWFAQAVLPRIRAARPGTGFDVLGARPPRHVRALARAGSGVHVAGHVADPLPYLERAAVMIVPIRAGSGMRVKILTALAQGLAVVSTAAGCAGIDVQPETHLLVADTADAFAEATLRLLGDRPLADALGRNGRRLIETRYDYRQVYAQWRPVYERLARASADPVRKTA
jgi:glycosyltransferase involved in cell wall biosynthesis